MHNKTMLDKLDKHSSYRDFENLLWDTCIDVSTRGQHQQAIDAAEAMVTELTASEYAWKNDDIRACLLEKSLYFRRIGNEKESIKSIRLFKRIAR
jgi:hypothetical protein